MYGPYFSPAAKGCHPARDFVTPDPTQVERLAGFGADFPLTVTIAPELPHAEEARQRVDEMQVLLRSVTAVAPPAAMPALEKEAKDYKIELDGIRGGGDVPSKRVKQQAFDSLRAPVSGW